ncbi:N-acetylmuramoyl-L-alanine amidase [Campylobacter hyointestinalis]|uniref:N-acetylmuramoyl-L-alanine amidase n=1 Tax=Campylobacter hyointestinalis TaxID=198 RepID=UPI000DCC0433|nr:N-acetylmuramoyl-L-alanine amidase [Campylobacter hyointestinalis]RAZ50424.1 N-acetylmuramoyl-L-alanine amidase [Campylobacter hyointestinalis subsp. lawsonii]
MGKIVKLFLLLLSGMYLFGADIDASIKEFDSKFSTSNKEGKLNIYHNLRGTYIQSIIKDNESLKLETLERLVKSAKELGIDYQSYEKELNTYKKTASQTSTKKPQIAKKQPIETEQKSEKNKTFKITQISSDQNKIILNLNSQISMSDIKSFNLGSQNKHRRVYDIEAILIAKSTTIKNSFSDEIRIGQFDKDSVRIVFSNEKKQDISFKIEENKIIFFLDGKTALEDTNKKTLKSSSIQQKQTAAIKKSFRQTKTIVLDPGHGGKDAGAVGSRTLYEKNIVLNVALKTGKILKDMGYKVHYTRDKDKFIGLRNRTSFANEKLADLFISIHANAAPNAKKADNMQGIETFFLSPTRSERSMRAANLENKSDTDEMNYFTKLSFLNFLNREKIIASNKLAIDIQTNLLKSVRTKYTASDGGVREAPFWVLVGALMPAVLVETGYITHPKEGKLLANDAYATKLAEGIAGGIDDYFLKNQ